MAKRTIASIGYGTAAVIFAGWLACASSESPADPAAANGGSVGIPESQRALDPAPGAALTLASLSEGGALEPGLMAREASAPVAEAAAELPAEVVSYLSGGLSDDGSLELRPTGEQPRGIPISMTPAASLLGAEYDFPIPSVAPPAAPAFD